MVQLVEFDIGEGATVIVEVDGIAPSGQRPVGRSNVAQKAAQGFDQALDSLRPVVSNIIGKLKEMRAPNEIKIEFGFKLNGELGAIIAKTEAEGNFKLSLTWKSDSSV
tara:strand:- start:60157 stop:60480 length:324 start_codon:yes stop_codon:yes gene_type:complete